VTILARRWKFVRRRQASPTDETPPPDGPDATRRQWVGSAAKAVIGGSVLTAGAALKPNAASGQTATFVDTTTNQTIGGVKTFTQPPVVPAGAFPQTAVSGLVAELGSKQDAVDDGTFATTQTPGTPSIALDTSSAPQVKTGTLSLTNVQPLILGAQGSAAPYLRIASLEADATWSLNSRQIVFNGTPDNVLTLGFNYNRNQFKQDPALPQIALQLESTFRPAPGAEIQSEFIVSATTPDNVTVRLLQAYLTHTSHRAIIQSAGEFNIYASDAATLIAQFDDAPTAPRLILSTGTALQFGNSGKGDIVVIKTAANQLTFNSILGMRFGAGGPRNVELQTVSGAIGLYGGLGIRLRNPVQIQSDNGGVTFFSGSGPPAADVGVNGDVYFRKDGAVGTCIYQKRAGAWVGTEV
jgi:hypothetical protein